MKQAISKRLPLTTPLVMAALVAVIHDFTPFNAHEQHTEGNR
jgi:hypothetical protein